MNIEIERKFILKQFPQSLPNISGTQFIFQLYLPDGKRIRRINNGVKISFEITTKMGAGLIREENNSSMNNISDAEFAKLLAYYPSIEKIRYYITEPFNTSPRYKEMVIDVFQNCNLLLYEVEFNNIEFAQEFHLPLYIIDYVDREVTNDDLYNNFNIARYINEKNKTAS